jgi:hypothetical protein
MQQRFQHWAPSTGNEDAVTHLHTQAMTNHKTTSLSADALLLAQTTRRVYVDPIVASQHCSARPAQVAVISSTPQQLCLILSQLPYTSSCPASVMTLQRCSRRPCQYTLGPSSMHNNHSMCQQPDDAAYAGQPLATSAPQKV